MEWEEQDQEQIYRNQKGVMSVLANWQTLRTLSEITDALHMRLDVERELKKLSYDERLAIYLLYWRGLTQGETAERMGFSQQYIGKMKYQAIKKIAKKLGEWL